MFALCVDTVTARAGREMRMWLLCFRLLLPKMLVLIECQYLAVKVFINEYLPGFADEQLMFFSVVLCQHVWTLFFSLRGEKSWVFFFCLFSF